MKSVGEAMAIGRNFKESLQKALRSLETGLTGLNAPEDAPDISTEEGLADMRAALTTATPSRLLMAAHALRQGMSQEDVCGLSHFSPWFIEQLSEIIATEAKIAEHGLPDNEEAMRAVKAMGFADARLAELTDSNEDAVRASRQGMNVRPYFRQIDTCAAEFAAGTPYLYSSYDAPSAFGGQQEAEPSDRKKAVILGGGPNRIGQGIEFDYCCCHAAYALEDAGIESIMVNCNPETVSTDYDTSDRLYFEPLTQEDVLEILGREQENGSLAGVIVQFGGQTPLKLSQALEKAGIPILGTDPDAIDLAEDRDRFKDLLERLGCANPIMVLPFG